MKTVYLGGPIIGRTIEEMSEWRERATAELTSVGYRVLSPLAGEHLLWPKDKIDAKTFRGVPQGVGRGTYGADRARVWASDIILFNFLGASEKSTGSTVELTWGFEWKKLNVVVMNKNNVHRHPWITEVMAGPIFEKLGEGLTYLKEIAVKGMPTQEETKHE